MTTSFKIRVLLLLLALSFAGTALTINLTFHKEDTLNSDSRTIESNLHKKEKLIGDYLANPRVFESLKTINTNRDLAEKTILYMREVNKIFLYTYRDHRLLFWGANRITPSTDAGLREGSNFVTYKTGYFEAVKKSKGNFSVVCYIPIKARYPYENKYLQNIFISNLITTDHLEIAELNDKPSVGIRNSEGRYLFSVKLKSDGNVTYYSRLELWAWLLAIFTSFLFINYLCTWLAEKGNVKASIGLFFVLFLIFRIATLKYNWFNNYFDMQMFNSSNFVPNFFFPTLGDFLLNTICATWFLAFAYRYRHQVLLLEKPLSKIVSYIVFALLGAIVVLLALQINDIFHDIVINSEINFDVTNIINLDYLSWIGILLLCLSVLNIYLLIDTVLAMGTSLTLSNLQRLNVFLVGIVVLLTSKVVQNELNVLFLLFAIVVAIRGYMIYVKNDEFNMGITVLTVLIFAVICSAKLSEFQDQRELYQQKSISQRLRSPNDPAAVDVFKLNETFIANDEEILHAFDTNNYTLLKNKLQKFYFDGYLSRYEFTAFLHKPDVSIAMADSDAEAVKKFKGLVVSGSIKVSKYFYHISNTFGVRDYFAIIPMAKNGKNIGTLFIDLKSKTFYSPDIFPKVLVDGKIDSKEDYKTYSFAFYKAGKLIGQYGKYVYNLNSYDFSGKLKQFVFIEKDNYSHLLYQPQKQLLIVVSRPNVNWVIRLASVSFIFLVLLAFAAICVSISWTWKNFTGKNNILRNFRWSMLISSNRVLYKTRIQASMVAAVVTTLVVVGFITYYSISLQYQAQQQQTLLENINKIAIGFEKKIFINNGPKINEQAFNAFAYFNAADLTYFDVQGKMIFTSQPKIYEYELIAPRMNALAYVRLNNFQQSEYINVTEQLGLLNFIAAYKPIRNSDNQTIGYLSLPYFSNVHDFEERIGMFLNTLINVYALVFVAIGFFAVFVANQITAPLTLVQKSLSQTKIGRKNEPIVWRRNDEIGSLVKEYNNMIAALDESTLKLARSERETAWKEMAKQVAHEIKNPLTPLKLGVQLLDKSYKENDPNFNKKFEKFSKSFIEQIESLAHIASEFSNFAKMPETTLEEVKLREIIEQSIEVYSKSEHATIDMVDEIGPEQLILGDKDQLLRCFNNLIKNAIEAIPEGREGIVRVIMEQYEGHAQIQISDNGRGIPEGLRERIFYPNFTTKSSGTGLGLAFVKQAINNMAGSIRLTTEHDTGTTFYITLPLA